MKKFLLVLTLILAGCSDGFDDYNKSYAEFRWICMTHVTQSPYTLLAKTTNREGDMLMFFRNADCDFIVFSPTYSFYQYYNEGDTVK